MGMKSRLRRLVGMPPNPQEFDLAHIQQGLAWSLEPGSTRGVSDFQVSVASPACQGAG